MAEHFDVLERIAYRDDTTDYPEYLLTMRRANEAVVDFEVYAILYVKDGQIVLNHSEIGGSEAKTRDEADCVLRGSLKFDGCMNYVAHENDTMAHRCGFDDWAMMLKAVKELYAMAAEFMPEHAAYLATS